MTAVRKDAHSASWGTFIERIPKLRHTDRNFVAISSQQVLHFDFEVTY